MEDKMPKLNKTGFLNALGALVYIIIVSQIMRNGNRLFGNDNFITPVVLLLLFTLSAITVGGLIIGKPLMLYLDDKKKEAVSLFLATVGWLAGFTIIALLIAFILR